MFRRPPGHFADGPPGIQQGPMRSQTGRRSGQHWSGPVHNKGSVVSFNLDLNGTVPENRKGHTAALYGDARIYTVSLPGTKETNCCMNVEAMDNSPWKQCGGSQESSAAQVLGPETSQDQSMTASATSAAIILRRCFIATAAVQK